MQPAFLHPELARLDQEYRQLVDAVNAGHLSADDAQHLLGSLVAYDGEGFEWRIDPYSGGFVRGVPNGPMQPADERLFAPSQLPPVHVPVLPHGTSPEMVSDHTHPALRPTPPVPTGKKVKEKSLKAARSTGGVFGTLFGGAGRLFAGRGRTVLVIGAFLLVAMLLVSRSPQGGGDTVTDPNAVATTLLPPATIVVPGVDPDPSASTTVVDPAAPTGPPEPSDADIANLITVLSSGNVSALLPADDDGRRSLFGMLGAPRAGFELSSG